MRGFGLVLVAPALAACAALQGQPPVPPADKDTCGARQYRPLVGKPASSPGVPDQGRLVTHIRPGTIVTMDLVPGRLSVLIDKNDIITAFGCG